jgi:xanthine dehydrogenase accessory factor
LQRVFNKLVSILEDEKEVDILTMIDSNPKSEYYIGQMLIIHADDTIEGQFEEDVVHNISVKVRTTVWEKPVTISVQDKLGRTYRLFWDRIINKARAIVFGGGHISQPLVQILSLLDFEVTVVDDRPEFANQARFPGAYQVICENFPKILQNLTIDQDMAVIIVTRGHRYDMDCLRAVMGSDTRYLGMIGSRRRIREIVNVLREEGAPEDLESRLRAPIGLDIKAETPAEIAVSIAAEVIAVLRGGSGCPLSGPKEVS